MSEALDIFMKAKKEIAEIRYVLPGSGEEVFLRPFTTKEQKSILKAMEKEDQILIGEAMDELIKKCVVSPEKFNPMTLLSKDRECLLIKLRQESVKEEFEYSWTCEECKTVNKVSVDLSKLEFEKLATADGMKHKEVKLNDCDITLILGTSTREDEKCILAHAKKNSAVKAQLSQAELLNAAYASVIKGIKVTKTKDVKDESGSTSSVEEDVIIKVPFSERLRILDEMSFDDKNKIKIFFEELEKYGFDTNLGIQTCKSCSNEKEQEMEWMSFFIM